MTGTGRSPRSGRRPGGPSSWSCSCSSTRRWFRRRSTRSSRREGGLFQNYRAILEEERLMRRRPHDADRRGAGRRRSPPSWRSSWSRRCASGATPRLILGIVLIPLFVPGISMGLATALFFQRPRHRSLAPTHRRRPGDLGAALRLPDHPDGDGELRPRPIARPPICPAPTGCRPSSRSSCRRSTRACWARRSSR